MSTSPSTSQGTPFQQRLLLTKHDIEPIVKKVSVIKKGETLRESSEAATYHKSPSSQVHGSNPACSDKKGGSEVKKHITEVYRRRRSVDTDYSFLDSDLAPMVREESRSSQKKRVLLKELHEDIGESRKGVKKLKVDHKDEGKLQGQSTDTEEVKDEKEFAATTIVEVNLQEDKTVENAKKKNKKNKNAGERHTDPTVLSQRGRLQQLVHGKGKRKGLEKKKTEVVDTETSPPEKRRHLTKQGRKLEKRIFEDKTEVIDSVKDEEVEASHLFFEKSEVEKDQHVRKEEELNLKSAQSIKSISCQGNIIVQERPADANASNTATHDSASLMPSSSKEVTDYPEIPIFPNEISSDDLQLEKLPDLVKDRTAEELEGSDENKNIASNRHHMALKKVMVKKYSVLKPKQKKTSCVQNNLEKHGEAVKYKARHPPKTTCDKGDLVPDERHLPDTDLVSKLEVLDFATKFQPPDELPGMETEVSNKSEHDAGFDFSRGAQANSTASEVLIRPQVKKGHERLKKAKCHTGEKVVLAECKNGLFASAKSSYPSVEATEGVLQETSKRIKPNSRKPSGAVSTGDLVKKIEGSEEVVASKNLLASPISLDCARCSINGWVWRSWARERAKKRLQSGVKTAGRKVMKDELPKLRKTKKMETNIVYKKTFDSVASLQAARQNRATLRKLAFASEGSDMLRFNLHKVGK